MIPTVALRDKRWRKFPLASFTTNRYDAHTELYQTVRFKLDALKKEELKVKAENDTKERAAEKNRQDEMQRLEEEKQAE